MCSDCGPNNKHGNMESAVEALKQSGFYWGGITSKQAKALLKDTNVGSFLVRDSADQRYLFTLTLKTSVGVTSVRIVMQKAMFRFDAGSSEVRTPSFESVVQLVHYYMEIAWDIKSGTNTQGKLTKDTRGSLLLYYPLYKGISSLKHLCRRTVNRIVIRPDRVHELALPNRLQMYLRQYPYSC